MIDIMKRNRLYFAPLIIASSSSLATGISSLPHVENEDSKISIDLGYYYQRSDWQGLNNSLADDAMNDIVRDAPYVRLNYQLFAGWYISGIYGFENISNDPKNDFLKIDGSLRESFFGAQVKGTLYESKFFDVGTFIQYTHHADYSFVGEFQTTALASNAYNADVKGLEDLLAGVMLEKRFSFYDLYGGAFYQNSQAEVTGNFNGNSIDNTLEVDSNIGGMLGANFHIHSQWDLNLEYQNRGDHGFDIALTYHFKKPRPEIVTRTEIVTHTKLVQVPEIGPMFYDGTIYFDEGITAISDDQKDKVRQLARFMEDNPKAKAQIDGHCDCLGPEAYNKSLSEERALSVKHYIMEYYGIEEERILLEGHGEAFPVETNETEEGRSMNRRVRIYATK